MTRRRKTGDILQDLQLSEVRWQAVIDSAQDAIVSIDEEGTITLFNKGAESIFGYRAEEVIGQSVAALMPEPYRAEHSSYVTHYQQTGEPKAIGAVRNVYARRKNGRLFPIELNVSEARVGDRVVYTAIIRDVTARQQMEEDLRRERDFAQSLIESAPVPILLLDPWGRVLRFNPCLAETTGVPLSAAAGRDWFVAFLPEADRDRASKLFAEVLQDRPVRGYVTPVLGRGGRPHEIEWHARALRDPNDRTVGVLAIGQDITERRRAERRLETQYLVTRVLAQSSSIAQATPRLLGAIGRSLDCDYGELWQLHPGDRRLERTGSWAAPGLDPAPFLRVSEISRDLTEFFLAHRVREIGRPCWIEDFSGNPDFASALGDTPRSTVGACGFPLREGAQVTGAIVFFHGGRCRPDKDQLELLDALGSQIGDFLHRQRAEEALRESEARFAQFMQNLPGISFMKDLENRYLYVNEGMEKLSGRAASELLGKTDRDIWSPEIAERLESSDRRVVASGRPDQDAALLPSEDGALHEWLTSRFPIRSDRGTTVMVGGVGIDVTERRRTEERLREMEKLAQERERLADIGAITAQIVHDLGNPLAAISMQAQLIVRRIRRDDSQPVKMVEKPAEQIVAKVRHLDSLIREFLDFAREQRLSLSLVDLSRLLREASDFWRPEARDREIQLTLDVASDLPTIRADEEKLRRVFDNLIKNAVEAIGRGPGRITISASAGDDDRIVVRITDTGPGLPQNLDIFRLFETTKPEGSGLGLPIVRQIVAAHGGGIKVANAQPHGAVFEIEMARRGPAG